MTKSPDKVRFSVIGLNHPHIYSQVDTLLRAGGELVKFYASEQDLAQTFSSTYPQATAARSAQEVIEDESIQLITTAAIPNERAALAVNAMRHGKDVMADKPGCTTLAQLAELRKAHAETGRFYSVLYGDRLESPATLKAAELVKAGAIGRVVQTIGLGPHKINAKARPSWFFNHEQYGGILCDIGSHQVDQFLFFTNSTNAEVALSQVANYNNPQYPELEDFGDIVLRNDHASGYVRVDWFTPDSLNTFGDGRLTLLGTEGYIEVRKNCDLVGRAGTNHLFLVNHKKTEYMECAGGPQPYGTQLLNDVRNRTETAMSQAHCFMVLEVSLRAQAQAKRIGVGK